MYSKYQFVSQGTSKEEQLRNIKTVLDKGVGWIQLRWKNKTEDEILSLAQEIKLLCENYNATFIINDFVSIAQDIDADGVHLGLNDTGISTARNILGKNKIIGGTANTLTDAVQRINEGCNYIGLGPYRYTETKANLNPVLGLKSYEKIMSAISAISDIPVYAIGGITKADIPQILSAGVYGIAASGMFLNENDFL